MELKSLQTFEVLNEETVHLITGGASLEDTKKGDVTSKSQDSKSDDGTPKIRTVQR
ncbi:hypothetical protein [Tenacibaculum litopenaei]|jgi:hypothetical protein|uniref:hypothetical protein n=1 Tax=Tenacibaculum litopenaei TaxID=396016 RepID=UPI0038B581C0